MIISQSHDINVGNIEEIKLKNEIDAGYVGTKMSISRRPGDVKG